MARIQLLLADDGNRRALGALLEERHTVVFDEQLGEADLYLVDETSFPNYRDALEDHKLDEEPVFCPVILIRREHTPVSVSLPDIDETDPPLVVNEVVTAPVGRQALFRTIANLLARRDQTRALVTDLQARDQRLREEQQKYATLVEQSASGIAVTRDGKFAFVNARMAEIAGRARETLRGMALTEVVATEYRDLVLDRHERRIAGEEPPPKYEIALVTPEGERKDIDLRASRITYDGEPAVLVLFRDITARKERERTLRKFKNAVRHAGYAIVLTDESGAIEYVNPAFEEMTGYSADEVMGASSLLFRPGDETDFYERIWETLRDGEVWTGESVQVRKSGERFVVNQTIAPIETVDGDIQGFVGIYDEITGRKLREQQLTVFHRVLRHNLRNKGMAIQGYAETVERQVDDPTSQEHLQQIRENVESLVEISEKANNVRRIISETLDGEGEGDLRLILDHVVETVQSDHPAAEISLVYPDASLEVDPRVTHAFVELLENAVKHTHRDPPRASIRVTVDGDTATVHIADDGPGIPEQEREVIANGTEEPLEHGSGLGLWVASWLVDHVGGEIDIEPQESGTTVSVAIPLH